MSVVMCVYNMCVSLCVCVFSCVCVCVCVHHFMCSCVCVCLVFSKLNLCEGGSFSPTIFKSDIKLFTTFRVLYLFVRSSALSMAKFAENVHIVLYRPSPYQKEFLFNLFLVFSLVCCDSFPKTLAVISVFDFFSINQRSFLTSCVF